MSQQMLTASPDPARPGRYRLGVVVAYLPNGEVEVDLVSWREMRRQASPEAFAHLARSTFSHWCAANDW